MAKPMARVEKDTTRITEKIRELLPHLEKTLKGLAGVEKVKIENMDSRILNSGVGWGGRWEGGSKGRRYMYMYD